MITENLGPILALAFVVAIILIAFYLITRKDNPWKAQMKIIDKLNKSTEEIAMAASRVHRNISKHPQSQELRYKESADSLCSNTSAIISDCKRMLDLYIPMVPSYPKFYNRRRQLSKMFEIYEKVKATYKRVINDMENLIKANPGKHPGCQSFAATCIMQQRVLLEAQTHFNLIETEMANYQIEQGKILHVLRIKEAE